ncbi:MAG: outer membrane lipoprotein-sorting protein [Gammaproteobacteria bacterium]|nr:MAG: outer membrane lipoprotein-sorting protein [Gammaproteobacteria bacterium]
MFSCLVVLLTTTLLMPPVLAEDVSAKDLVRQAVDHFRGLTSYSEMTMIIHRPDWERSMTMRAWTQGDDNTLVRVTEPRKDAGNGTLMLDDNMWTFSPKINRVIKIPSSMMSQNWMGSDFSNKDISKTTDIIDQYDHTLIDQQEQDGHQVYTIQSIPHEDAAIVWGKEVLVIRDDWVLLEQQFWDQDGVMLKTMKASDIQVMSGRMVATKLRMGKLETPGEWTELQTLDIQFGVEIASNVFTLSNLRNPRE